jgi:peptidoglycan/xylan/chitin deacetylase (PgdA/CDA1 family)
MVQGTLVDQNQRQALIAVALDALEIPVTKEYLLSDEDHRPLTTQQITKMASSGLAVFASHSVNHYSLPQLDTEGKREELIESKRQIEKLTGTSCSVFCAPTGFYDDECLDEVFAAGYDHFLSSNRGTVDLSNRTINRNVIFRSDAMHEFVDLAHGPVFGAFAATRTALSSLGSFAVRSNTR